LGAREVVGVLRAVKISPRRGSLALPRRARLVAMLLLLAAPVAAAVPTVEPVAQPHRAAIALDGPQGIAIDARRGEVLVANTGAHRIETYDFAGRRIAGYMHRVRAADGRLVDGAPSGLAIDAAGRTLIVDRLAAYVDVIDARGVPVTRIEPGGAPGCVAPANIAAVAVMTTGEILVAAGGESARVYRFDARYRALGCWGEPGTEPGRLAGVTGIAGLPDGGCAITCARTHFAVQVFSASGEFVRGFGLHEIGPGNFSYPSGVTASADGRLWVSDEIRHIVQVFDSAGSCLGAVGGQGEAPGEFLYPSALSGDGKELLAVSERVGNRYQLLRIR
jgi:DNA-binding beta-propeller fold protein YncE